ncbi:hypothetical protein [Arsenicicoccus bolidensis]|uniref:hypothetical protein n=1 Tax=Arsenicicoccus bolidensis TaxID=229480 RepID=UPI0028A8604C|nr:hypothetical protein [Arsenicicoccus bolidensis]
MDTRSRIIAGLVAAPLAIGTLAACGAGTTGSDAKAAAAVGSDAKGAFFSAYDKTGDSKRQRVTTKLEASPDTIIKLASSMGSGSGGSTSTPSVSPKIAQLISGSSIVVDMQSTGAALKDETDPTKINTAMSWKTDSDLFNLRTAAQDTFVKLDLAKIADQTGAFSMADVQGALGQAPTWIKDAVNGKWVGFDKGTVEQLAKSGGAAASTNPTQLTPDQTKQLTAAVKSNLDTNGTFTSEGDTVKVQVKIQPFLTQMFQDGKRIAPKQFTDQMVKDATKSLGEFKAGSVLAFDATIADGRFTAVKGDVMQVLNWFDETKAKDAKSKKELQDLKAKNLHLTLVSQISELDRDVTKPEGARMVTKAELEQLGGMGGSMGKSSSGSGSGSGSASAVPSAPAAG